MLTKADVIQLCNETKKQLKNGLTEKTMIG